LARDAFAKYSASVNCSAYLATPVSRRHSSLGIIVSPASMSSFEERESLVRPGHITPVPEAVSCFFYICIGISSLASFMCGFSLGFSSPTLVAFYKVPHPVPLSCEVDLLRSQGGHNARHSLSPVHLNRSVHAPCHTLFSAHRALRGRVQTLLNVHRHVDCCLATLPLSVHVCKL
jgi:hypothetical protein